MHIPLSCAFLWSSRATAIPSSVRAHFSGQDHVRTSAGSFCFICRKLDQPLYQLACLLWALEVFLVPWMDLAESPLASAVRMRSCFETWS